MKKRQIIVSLMLIIAIIGFIDATHLTISHFNGSELNCGATGGCNIVTTSEYSQIFGIPTALFGSIYYFVIATLSLAYLQNKQKIVVNILTYLPITGFIMSAWFVYLQLYVINAICIYCMGSAVTSSLLFILSLFLKVIKENKKEEHINS